VHRHFVQDAYRAKGFADLVEDDIGHCVSSARIDPRFTRLVETLRSRTSIYITIQISRAVSTNQIKNHDINHVC
jgi:hypothetical protein